MKKHGDETLPANHTEPWESVIKRIAASDVLNIIIWGSWRQFSFVVVHFTHQLQPLSIEREWKKKIFDAIVIFCSIFYTRGIGTMRHARTSNIWMYTKETPWNHDSLCPTIRHNLQANAPKQNDSMSKYYIENLFISINNKLLPDCRKDFFLIQIIIQNSKLFNIRVKSKGGYPQMLNNNNNNK